MSRLGFIIILFSFIGSFQLYAQDEYRLPDVIPPPANAASLGNYGNIPIGYYTGTPNVSIPFYEIKEGSITVPITLNYDATGVKVSQEASWVGLNWALSCGGVVSRTIMGSDDFGSHGYQAEIDLGISILDTMLRATPSTNEIDWDYYKSINTVFPHAISQDFIRPIQEGIQDAEPDVFTYSFGTYSGKFLFDKPGRGSKVVLTNPDHNLVIEKDYDLTKFTITTPNGARYVFGSYETIYNYSSFNDFTDSKGTIDPTTLVGVEGMYTSQNNVRPSSWYLDSIVSPKGDVVEFFYKSAGSLSLPSQSYSMLAQLNSSTITQKSPYIAPSSADAIVSRQIISDLYLDSIRFSSGWIKTRTSPRYDIEQIDTFSLVDYGTPQKLSQIEVYNNGGHLVKKIKLNTSYFENPNPSVSTYLTKRLKLDSLLINQNEEYKFEYKNPDQLPHKLSYSKDVYGFYFTGGGGTYKLSPYLNIKVYDERTDTTGEKSQNGILTSIKYPTKGSTHFEYEPHTFVNANIYHGIRSDSLFLYRTWNDNSLVWSVNSQQTFEITNPTSVPYQTVAFTLTTDFNKGEDNILAELRDSNGSLVKSFKNGLNQYNQNVSTLTHYVDLSDGQYELKIMNNSYIEVYPTIDSVRVSTQIEANFNVVNYTEPVTKGFGNRIKKITNLDKNGTEISSKRFWYDEGKRLAELTRYYTFQDNLEDNLFMHYLVSQLSSSSPVGLSYNPVPVGYSGVTVEDLPNNGKTIYNYHNNSCLEYHQNLIHGTQANSGNVPQLYDPRNGKLLSIDYFNAEDELIQKTENTYICKDYHIIKGLKMYPPQPPGQNYFLDGIRFYDEISEWWVQESTIETSSFNGEPVEIITSFHYDNDEYKQLTSKTTSSSVGSKKVESYKYPYDVTGSVYEDMVSDNILNPVIEKSVVFENTTDTLSRVKTEYDTFSGKALPEHVYVRNSETGAMEKRLTYDNYSLKGRVQGVHQENNISMAYVWGYKEQYPVLKITGLSYSFLSSNYSSIVSYFSNDSNLPLNLSHTALKAKITTLKGQLNSLYNRTDCQVELYTYDPLVGVTSQTDANGVTVFYEYDDEGRLEYLKDDDGNILKKYEYHYATVNP